MKIVYIADSLIPSRTANSIHVMKMCHAYVSLGHQVTLVIPNRQHNLETGIEDIFTFYGLPSRFEIAKIPFCKRCFDLLYFGIILPFFAFRKNPTVVHTRSLGVAWGLTKLFKIPTIYELHNIPSKNKRQQALFKEVTSSKHLKALVVITTALAKRVEPLLDSNIQSVIAPDGVDETWLHSTISRTEARLELNLAHEHRSIAIYTGHLYKGRGIELIIELARHTKEYLFLVIGGRDSDIATYTKQCENLPNLRFLGFKPPAQMFLYLRSADVLLMPYANHVETVAGIDTSAIASPMKMFEYMSAERPILASTLPVLQEILKDKVNALLLPYEQPELWLAALNELKQNPGFASSIAQQARIDAKKYSWKNRAARLLENVQL